ncbi:MAG: serine hydrolase, partial [Bacteroidales bacterium]|nr:serine hydrolase [Bacteroidales bacterium]
MRRVSFVTVAALVLAFGLAGCKGSGKVSAERQKAFEDSLISIITEANIPMIQAMYTAPADTVYCQVGITPWAEDSVRRADYEHQAIFQAASLSKVVFAYIVLKMYDLGEIDIDRPLYEYTDIERFTDKEQAKKLTARLILMHRSGIDDWAASPSSDEWPTAP